MDGQPSPIAQSPDPLPERLGRYRLVRPISTGGMARVFEGRRESLAGVSPRVAIKVILPDFAADEAFQQLFVNEARIGSQLQHQNLVQIQDFDREGELFYLVMEFVDGVTLRRVIGLCRRHGLLVPVTVLAEIGRQVAEGLHHAHLATAEDGTPLHLVHRDVKPSNLMLNTQGLVKVLDFGVSKALFSRERSGTVKGTWGYMAPEQAHGTDVGPLADIFGLAAVLYELAALQPLFPEKEPAALKDLLARDEAARRAVLLSGPHGTLAPVLVRALQRDPAARFPSALAFGRALEGLIQDPVIAREQLVQFRLTLDGLEGEGSGPAQRSWSTLSRAGSGSSPPPALAPPSAGPGLPIAIGAAPADLHGPPREPRARSRTPLLLVLLGLLVLGFAGWKVLAPHPRLPAQPALRPEDVPSLESVVGDRLLPALPRLDVVQEPTPAPATSRAAPAARTPAARPAAPEVAPEPATPAASPEGAGATTTPGGASRPAAAVAAPGGDAAATSPEAPSTAPAARSELGILTVSAFPKAQVSVDGQFVRWAPLYQYPLPPGPHTVTLVTEDGRRTTFRVELEAGVEVRRVWHFDKGTWVENW